MSTALTKPLMRKTEKIEIHKPDHSQQDDIQEVWCKCGWNDIQREAGHWWGQVVTGKQPEWRLFREANVAFASQAFFSAATGRLSCLYLSNIEGKISTASSPKNRPLRIWLRSEWHRHLDRLDQWSMYPKSPPSKNDFYEFCILLAVF